MKVKIAEATPIQIDYLVARCESVEVEYLNDGITKCLLRLAPCGRYCPTTDWAQAGPIIEREKIDVIADPDGKDAWMCQLYATRLQGCKVARAWGPTPLIAAMRAFVLSKLGDEVDVPEELV